MQAEVPAEEAPAGAADGAPAGVALLSGSALAASLDGELAELEA